MTRVVAAKNRGGWCPTRVWLYTLGWAWVLMLASPGYGQQSGDIWLSDIVTAQRRAATSGKLILIHFWSSRCQPCRFMNERVLTNPQVVQFLGERFEPVKINVDQFPYMAKQYGVSAVPTCVIVAPTGEVLQRWVGATDSQKYLQQLSQVHSQWLARVQTVAASPPTLPAAPNGQQPAVAAVQPQLASSQAGTVGASAPSMSAGSWAPLANSPAVAAGPSSPQLGGVGTPSAVARSSPAVGPSVTHDQNRVASQGLPPTGGGAIPSPPAYSPDSAGRLASTSPSVSTMGITSGEGVGSTPGIPSAAGPVASPNTTVSTLPQGSPPASAGAGIPAALPQQSFAPVPAENSRLAGTGPATGSAPVGSGDQIPPAGPPAAGPPLGLDGFCPVSLSELGQWIPGDPRWGMIHEGRLYLFAGPNERAKFAANPERYAPVFSGYDVVIAIDKGSLVPGKREFGGWFEGRMYLFGSEETLRQFDSDPRRYVSALANRAAIGQPQSAATFPPQPARTSW